MHSNIQGSSPAICPSLLQFDRSGGLPMPRQWGTVVASTAGLCTTSSALPWRLVTLAWNWTTTRDPYLQSIFIKSWSWHTSTLIKWVLLMIQCLWLASKIQQSQHRKSVSFKCFESVLYLLYNQNYRTGSLSTEVKNEGRWSLEDPCHCFIPMALQSGSSLTSVVSRDPLRIPAGCCLS